MKVVQINSVCGIGSTGRIATDLSKTMSENNIENYILYGVGYSDYPFGIRIGNNINIRMHQLLTRILGWHGYASHLSTKQLITQLQKINPDVIHLHNIHGFYLNIEMLFHYLKKNDKRVIWTFHDCWPFTGHCAYFDYEDCEKWKTGCNVCPQKSSYPVTWWFDRSKEQWEKKYELFTSINGMQIVTPSEWLSELVKQSFLKDYPIKVINNGIDLDVFKPTKTSFREDYNVQTKFIVLGVASSWDRRKGLTYFYELEKKLNDHYQIVLVGLSGKQKEELPKGIIGITRTDNLEQLVELYSVANVLVNPTLEDNFPTVNLEAIACGTPVITFNSGGSPESLDNTCGVVVESGNIEELVSAIEKVCNQPLSQDSCVKHASNYRKKDKFMEYINLYRNR